MALMLICSMFFIHCIVDFCTQRVLADLKQKKWWEENYPDKMYEKDYKGALLVHSFMWSFAVMLPLIWFSDVKILDGMFVTLILNTIIHSYIDDLKANKVKISLNKDQALHALQIVATWLVWMFLQWAEK